MAQLSELKRGKVMKLAVLSLLLLTFTGLAVTLPVVTVVKAVPTYLEPDGWSDPPIWLQDTNKTPGPKEPWYDDVSGPGQQQRELLYVGIDWDEDYVYVRWDFEALPNEITSVYYLIKIDTENLTAPEDPLEKTRGTHALGIEVDQNGIKTVTIRTYGHPKFPLVWEGDNTDLTVNSLPVLPGDPFYNRTAIEGRFPWSWPADGYPAGNLTASGGPEDFLVITAQSHANQGDSGWTSAIKDYIGVADSPVPWFTDLGLTLLATTVLVVVIKKKKIGLPVSIDSGA
jgi:hypothetical protein